MLLRCRSDVFIADVQALDRKGLNVDDITLEYCTEKIPELWPNTFGPISAVRFLRPWNPDWDRPRRKLAMQQIADYAISNGVKVLLTTSVTCYEDKDNESWSWTKDILHTLGPNNILGLAVGDEIDQYYRLVTKGCAEKVWDEGRFWSEFKLRVKDLDAMGLSRVPVTAVLSTHSLHGGYPFTEIKGQALIKSFLKNATEKYGTRFVFTVNLDPYHDPSLKLDEGSTDTCFGALDRALCWDSGCLVPDTLKLIRQRIDALTGSQDYRFWVGKVGWANENSSHLHTEMQYCKNFSTNQSLETFYKGFLQWDFTMDSGQPPEFVFYQGLRDVPVFGPVEHFGLIETCESETCKIIASNITMATQFYGQDLWWLPWVGAILGVIVCCLTIGTAIYVNILRVTGKFKLEDDDLNSREEDSDGSASSEY